MTSQPDEFGINNEESGKKKEMNNNREREKMNVKMLLLGMEERSQKAKKVFFWFLDNPLTSVFIW